MQSTGEVIGIHEDARVALAKALRGAGLVPSAATNPGEPPPLALLSIADRDKPLLPRLAAALHSAGFRLAATDGTREALRAAGFEAELVAKLASVGPDGRPVAGAARDLVGVIRSVETRIVVNTPTPRSGPVRDAAEIRHAAIEEGVPCLTAIETAIAAVEALEPEVDARVADVRSIAEWLGMYAGAEPLDVPMNEERVEAALTP
jgi:carbamoyl-phosphate synthase large subunit